MANITLYELGYYNNGQLVPCTFDLDEIDSQDDWHAAISTWLHTLTVQTHELCEEWIVAD